MFGTNIFGYSREENLERFLGPDHPINLVKKNRELLEKPLRVDSIVKDKKLKKPFPTKGFNFYEGRCLGKKYEGELLDKRLRLTDSSLPCFTITNKDDNFEANYQIVGNRGFIVTIQQKKKSYSRLKNNLNYLENTLFKYHEAEVVEARGNTPRLNDFGSWFTDRRSEKVYYNDDFETTRLAKFWCLTIPHMIPLKVLASGSNHDELMWFGPAALKEMPEELKEKLNDKLPYNSKWQF